MSVWLRIPLVIVVLLSGLHTCVGQWGVIAPPNDCAVVGNSSDNVMYVWDTTFNSTACDYLTQFSKSLFPQCFSPSWKGSPEVRTQLINAATVGDGCNRFSRIFVSNVYTPARQSTLSQSAPCNADIVDLVSRGKAAGLLVYALLAVNDLPFTEQYQAQTIVDWNVKCPTARFSGIAVNNEKLHEVKCTNETAERIILDGLLNTANIAHNDSMLLHFSLGFHWSSCGSDWNNLTWRGFHKPLTQHIWDVIDTGDIQVATARVTNMVSRLIRADGGQYAGSLNKTSYTLAYTNFNPGAGDCTVSYFPLAPGVNCSDGINKTEASMWTQLNAAGANLRSTTGNQRIGGGVHYYSGIYSAGVPGWPYRGGPSNVTLVLQTPAPTATPSISSSPTPSSSVTSSTTASATRSRTQTASAAGSVTGAGSTTATLTPSVSATASTSKSSAASAKPGPLDSSAASTLSSASTVFSSASSSGSRSPTSTSTQSATSSAAGSGSPTSSRSPSSAASVPATSSVSQSAFASASVSGSRSPTSTRTQSATSSAAGSGSPTSSRSPSSVASVPATSSVSQSASASASSSGSRSPTSTSTQSATSSAAGSGSPTSSLSPSSIASVPGTSSVSQSTFASAASVLATSSVLRSVSAAASSSGQSSSSPTGSPAPTRSGSRSASASTTGFETISGVAPASASSSATGSRARTSSLQSPSLSASSSARSSLSGSSTSLASRTGTPTHTPSATTSQNATGTPASSSAPSSLATTSRTASSTNVAARTASRTWTSAPSHAVPAVTIPGSPPRSATITMRAGSTAIVGGNGVNGIGMSDNNAGGLVQSSLAPGQPEGSRSTGSSRVEIGLGVGIACIALAAASIAAAWAWKSARFKRPRVAVSKTPSGKLPIASLGSVSTKVPSLAKAVEPDVKMTVTTNPFAAHAPKAQFLPRTV